METNKVPTAEEILDKNAMSVYDDVTGSYILKAMIEFAKLHVQAALEAALENAPYGSSTDTVSYKDMKDAILNSYNYDNIK